MRLLQIIICFLMMAIGAVESGAQGRWLTVTDTLMKYGAVQTFYVHDSVRVMLAEREEAVGYEQTYAEYYDMLCRAANLASSHRDSLMYDLNMCRQFMAWQYGKLSENRALGDLLSLVQACRVRYGETSAAYQTVSGILALFHCATGNYAAVDSCCQRIVNYKESHVDVYRFHLFMAYHAQMVARVGLGQFNALSRTAGEISDLHNKYCDNFILSVKMNTSDLDYEMVTDAHKNEAARLARQILWPMLPPSPQAVQTYEIEPWPLSMVSVRDSVKALQGVVLSLFNMQELLFRLNISKGYCGKMSASIDDTNRDLFDYRIFRGIPPRISSELCRRSAMVCTMHAEMCDTISYRHDDSATEPMKRWRHCLVVEQLNRDGRSALALIRFATEWIRKGYPLSMQPFIDEAVGLMRRDFAVEHPTQHQMLLCRQNRQWLRHDLLVLVRLTSHLPEYATTLAALRELEQLQKRK